jgi:hypothetical protein
MCLSISGQGPHVSHKSTYFFEVVERGGEKAGFDSLGMQASTPLSLQKFYYKSAIGSLREICKVSEVISE